MNKLNTDPHTGPARTALRLRWELPAHRRTLAGYWVRRVTVERLCWVSQQRWEQNRGEGGRETSTQSPAPQVNMKGEGVITQH